MESGSRRRAGLVRALFALAALAVVFAVGSVAMAQSEGVIFGCKSKVGGLLRVVGKPGSCKDNETSISWNRQGPKGERGPAGVRGPQGPAGRPPAFRFDEESATVNTSDDTEYRDLGGPQVTITVPNSGYIEVGASAFLSGGPGAVAAFDVTDPNNPTPLPGQSKICASFSDAPPGSGLLFSSPGNLPGGPSGNQYSQYSTPTGAPSFGFCANTGGPSTILMGPLDPGEHTIELRYAACGCGGASPSPAFFKDRRMWAQPAPNAPVAQ